ncbi:MAG: hypothetical protein HY718_05880, partial [Planctomycetes bacterium]|nr:hypothetical protein [Planctomycetota bacterium]
VGTGVGAVLALDPDYPDFTVEIQGIDGQVVDAPGFFIDSIELPALGPWLSFTHVPVVMLDVASPEGGVLEGIIGMNLLNRYNVLLRGGGLPDMAQPRLDVEPLPGVDADFDDDGDVDAVDFAYLEACLSGYDVPQGDAACQAMRLDGDADIDHHDVKLFVDCASGPGIPAVPECVGP